jgi:MFS family permease
MTGAWGEFRLLWAGQSVSRLGSEVTLVALPLTAILVLGASPTQMGLLMAAGYLPAAAVGLLAGAWVDRVRRRPLLIGCQLMLGLTTSTVPLAAWLGALTFEWLLVIQAINGALAVLASAASVAYLPSLVPTAQLGTANARLATSNSVAHVVGPAFAGVLVQVLSAPTAILADAISFLCCGLCVGVIKNSEPSIPPSASRKLRADIKEGLYLVLGHRLLRPMVLALGTYNLFAALFTGIYTLFMVRELGLTPTLVGAVFACGGTGGVLGGLVAGRVMRRIGTGRSVVAGAALLAIMHLPAAVAGGPPLLAAMILACSGVVAQLGFAVLQVSQTTLTQWLVPAYVLGRVTATRQVVVVALVPLGFALGGVIGDAFGLRTAVAVGAVGTLLSAIILVRSPLWTADLVEPDSGVPVDESSGGTQPNFGEMTTRYGLRPTAQWYGSAQTMLPASAARRT